MTYTPADVPSFSGLDLRDIEDATGAIAATDCLVDPDGTLVPRGGYTKYGTGTVGVLPTGSLALTASTVPIRNIVPNPKLDSPTGWTADPETQTELSYPSGTVKFYNPDKDSSITAYQSAAMEVKQSTNYKGGFKVSTISAVTAKCEIQWYNDTTPLDTPATALDSITTTGAKTFSITSPANANRAVIRFQGNPSSTTAFYFSVDEIWLTTTDYTGSTFFSEPIISEADVFVVGYSTGPLALGATGSLKSYNLDGALIAQTGTLTAGTWSLTELDGFVYAAAGYSYARGPSRGASRLALYRVTKDTISQPTCATRTLTERIGVFTSGRTMPKPYFVGKQTPDNRLVAAGFFPGSDGPNGTEATPATIFFSQPNQPEKWDETEFEVVGATNDPIIGLSNWGDYLLVFKEREWYVFYGNSVRSDGTGLAVFNYRKVEAGCTVVSSVAGSRALYVMDSDGNIRATTGGVPQVIFSGDTSKYSPSGFQGFRAGRFIGFPVTGLGAFGYLVLDEDSNMVFFWSVSLPAGAAWDNGALFPHSTSGIVKFPEGTTDNGTAVTASYTSAYSSWGQAGVEKSVRQTFLHGDGTVNLSWAKDLQEHGFARSVTMKFGKGIDRNAVRGESLSFKLTGSAFSLNRLVPMLREQRPPGVRS